MHLLKSSALAASQLAFVTHGFMDPPVSEEQFPGWREDMKHPNATGVYPINGYNVSQDDDGNYGWTDKVDGWTARVRVGEWTDPEIDLKRIGVDFKISPPEGLDVSGIHENAEEPYANNGKFCVNFSPQYLKFKDLSDDEVDDGDVSCAKYLPEECYNDLLAAHFASAFAGSQNCSTIDIPKSCPKLERSDIVENSNITGEWYSSNTNVSYFDDIIENKVYQTFGDEEDYDLSEAYADALDRIWFLGITWPVVSGEAPDPTLMCLRATNETAEEDHGEHDDGDESNDGDDEDEEADGGNDGDDNADEAENEDSEGGEGDEGEDEEGGDGESAGLMMRPSIYGTLFAMVAALISLNI